MKLTDFKVNSETLCRARKLQSCFTEILLLCLLRLTKQLLGLNRAQAKLLKPSSLALLLSEIVVYLILVFLRKVRSMSRQKYDAPFADISYRVPGGHWFLGHIKLIGDQEFVKSMTKLCVTHSCPQDGISTYWSMNTPAVSFLKAEDVLQLFRLEHQRTVPQFLERHWFKFLGVHSLGKFHLSD